ncbi:efflux RND transporter periplasmic adaptor subunit [Methylobacterium flocculans]|uniref:efflux RND transporter periplasmic adaptor subunit n=1 Tax=Methylobacterium flocculans TaxID=2984843 RepID=UPI0021F253EC|nr:efflux RND transporter periplasmic adaptor subunit [Methylobacterium sp. FF17]
MTQPSRDPSESPPPPPGKTPFVLTAVAAVGLLAWGGYGQMERRAAAAETQRKMNSFVPKLRTATVERADKPIEITLPGQTDAFAKAALYARATGYIAERRADLGSRVRRGDVLMRIAAPDLDQQLAQAEAQTGQFEAALLQARSMVDQAKANVNLANVTNSRTTTLAGQGWASKQNADNSQASVLSQAASLASAEAGVKVAQANIKAQAATVERLRALTGFKEIVAPFDGVVTQRGVDVGDLVHADGTGTALLSIDRDDVLRVSVNVPQNVATGVRPGVVASIKVPQMPDRTFSGKVERSSVALLSSSRTLTAQVDVPNPDRALRAGLYVYVTLKVPRTEATMKVPAESLVFNQRGTQVAVVRDDGTVRWHGVTIRRDLGTTVELAQGAADQGLEGGEQIVLSPPADLREGQKIERQPAQTDTKPLKSAAR